MAMEHSSQQTSVTSTTEPVSPVRKRQTRKPTDPFLKLSNDIRPPAPVEANENDSNDSIFLKFLVAPLITISFILSLSLVDFRNRSYRQSEHSYSSSQNQPWRSFRRLLDPEPYTAEDENEWIPLTDTDHDSNPGTNIDGVPAQVKHHDGRKWVLRKKHRAVTGMQLSDAWEMRRSVMVALIAGLLIVIPVLCYCVVLVWRWVKR